MPAAGGTGDPRRCSELAGASVLVTGAASGIGAATARRFAEAGAFVYAADADAAVEAVVEELREVGAGATALTFDQSDDAAVRRSLASVRELAVACLNAGTSIRGGDVATLDVDTWSRLQRVNLDGAFFVARAVIPLLRAAREAAIVFTASVSGLRGHRGSAAYAASKAGLIGLARSLALELAPEGIRVNSVCPGAVRTPLLESLLDEEELAAAADDVPLGRLATPGEVAEAIFFLASPQARHITGTELIVDGGQTAR